MQYCSLIILLTVYFLCLKNNQTRIPLLVTEIFDAGLFGEGVLPTLIHAWENLLLPPLCSLEGSEQYNKSKAVVVPFSATVWVAAVQCIDIARR